MKMTPTDLRTGLFSLAIALIFAASTVFISSEFTRSTMQQSAGSDSSAVPSQMTRTLEHGRSITRLADGHADICYDNEQQCLKGCDGATSCSNQCIANYDGCMAQGG